MCVLQAGGIVRLFHKEAEGYLTNEKEQDSEDHTEKVFLDTQRGKESTNSNSLWLLEREKSTRGGICHFADHYRLKHVTTGRFLTCVENKMRGKRKSMYSVLHPRLHPIRQCLTPVVVVCACEFCSKQRCTLPLDNNRSSRSSGIILNPSLELWCQGTYSLVLSRFARSLAHSLTHS